MTDLPYRQLSRLTTELFVSYNETSLRLFPRRFAEAVAFAVVARTCAPDWIDGRTLAAPATPSRSIAANAVAISLNRPVETTRRHINWLIEQDFLVRADTGVALSPSPDNAGRVIAFYERYHDLLIRLFAEIGETCDLDLTGAPSASVAALAIVERALDIALVPLDSQRVLIDDFDSMLVWITIGAANIRHVTFDPVLSRRYAINASPNDLRRPVSLHSIAKALAIPYSTTWRKAQGLEQAKLLARRDAGWVVLMQHLRMREVEQSVTSTTQYIIRKMRELAKLGLHPDRLEPAYLNGRPPLARIDAAGL